MAALLTWDAVSWVRVGWSLCALLLVAQGCDSPPEAPPAEAAEPEALPEIEAPPPPPPTPACEVEMFELARDPISRPHRVAVAADGTGLFLGWTLQRSTDEETREIAFLGSLSAGTHTSLDRSVAETESRMRAPALAPPFLLWLEESAEGRAVRTHRFVRSRPQAFDDLRRGTVARRELGPPQAVGVGETLFATWAEHAGDAYTIRLQRFDQEQLGVLAEITLDAGADELAISATEDELGVAWREGTTLKLQRFDHELEPLAEAVELATNATGSLDLALDGDASALVYVHSEGGRRVARIVRIDERGQPIAGAEVDVNEAPENARRVALARYGSGYAVAYRATRAGGHAIDVAFFDGDLGRVAAHSRDSTSWEHGELTMAVSERGAIGLGWAEQHREDLATYTALLGARLRCSDPWEQLGGDR